MSEPLLDEMQVRIDKAMVETQERVAQKVATLLANVPFGERHGCGNASLNELQVKQTRQIVTQGFGGNGGRFGNTFAHMQPTSNRAKDIGAVCWRPTDLRRFSRRECAGPSAVG